MDVFKATITDAKAAAQAVADEAIGKLDATAQGIVRAVLAGITSERVAAMTDVEAIIDRVVAMKLQGSFSVSIMEPPPSMTVTDKGETA